MKGLTLADLKLLVRHPFRIARQGLYQDRPQPTLRHYVIQGLELEVLDLNSSIAVDVIARELEQDDYQIDKIPFQAGDVVIDVGANVGMVSIYLAKRRPDVTIYAFEPIPSNFRHLVLNLRLNQVTNVRPFNLAITADGRPFPMVMNAVCPAGATGCLRDLRPVGHEYHTIASTTLDDVFQKNQIVRCRMLKIDCEGAEHEVLTRCSVLDRIEYLSAEFHINSHLRAQGYDMDKLVTHCAAKIDPEKMKITRIEMHDG